MEHGAVPEKVRSTKGPVMEGFRKEWHLNGGRKQTKEKKANLRQGPSLKKRHQDFNMPNSST